VPQLNRVEDAVIRYLNRKPANEGPGGGAGGS
jgi:SWI/SNF-related matrix-associated actin-dependent regulator of chromatin subfamily D